MAISKDKKIEYKIEKGISSFIGEQGPPGPPGPRGESPSVQDVITDIPDADTQKRGLTQFLTVQEAALFNSSPPNKALDMQTISASFLENNNSSLSKDSGHINLFDFIIIKWVSIPVYARGTLVKTWDKPFNTDCYIVQVSFENVVEEIIFENPHILSFDKNNVRLYHGSDNQGFIKILALGR